MARPRRQRQRIAAPDRARPPAGGAICAGAAHSAKNRIFHADPDTTRKLRQGERNCFEQML
jgi:hypothetical protein